MKEQIAKDTLRTKIAEARYKQYFRDVKNLEPLCKRDKYIQNSFYQEADEILAITTPELDALKSEIEELKKKASQISALFNTEEIREKIAEWLYNHEQLKYQTKTLSWNELPEIAKQVWLNNAFQILSLIFPDQKQEVCPECKGK